MGIRRTQSNRQRDLALPCNHGSNAFPVLAFLRILDTSGSKRMVALAGVDLRLVVPSFLRIKGPYRIS